MSNNNLILLNTNNLNLIIKKNINNNKLYIYLLKLSEYFNFYGLGKDVIYVSKLNKLFFKNKSLFNVFKNTLIKRFYEMNNGIFIDMILKGIGYNFYIYNKYLFIDLGFSHYIGIKISKNLILRKFKYRLIIFSYSKILAKNFSKKLSKLRSMNIYKGKGFLFSNVNLKLKEGKKR